MLWKVCSVFILALFSASSKGAALEDSTFVKDDRVIVIIGASYAGDWPVSSVAGLGVINKGLGGNQSFEIKERFRTDVIDLNPDAVLIWGFINDIFRSAPEEMSKAKERIKSSYIEMIDFALENQIEVYVATEVPVRQPAGLLNSARAMLGELRGKISYQTTINRHVVDVNDWLEQYAESKDIKLLDFHAVVADMNGERKKEFAVDDGSHLSKAAYQALSTYTDGRIRNLAKDE